MTRIRELIGNNRKDKTEAGRTLMNTARVATVWAAMVAVSGILMGPSAFGDLLTWNTTTGNWDTTTANWTGEDTLFADDATDDVTFDNSAGGAVTVSPNMTPASTTVSAVSGTYTFTGGVPDNAAIDGGVLNKSGGGTLDLRATLTNGFSAINLAGGKVFVDQRNASNGSVNQLGTGAITVSENTTLSVTPTIAASSGDVVNPMTIASGKVMTLTREASSPYPSYTGLISGAGELRVAGTAGNYWRVSNASNSFSGGLTITGNSWFTSDGAMGNNSTITGQSGSLRVSGTMGAGKTIAMAGAFGLIAGQWDGIIQGNGFQLFVNNCALNNAANSQASTFNNIGTLRVGVAGSLGAGPLSYTSNPNNYLEFFDPVGGTFANTLNMSSGDNRTLKVENAAAVIDWTGAITSTNNTQTVHKTGPGTFVSSDWRAILNIDVAEGTLTMNDTVTANVGNVTVQSGATLNGVGEIDLAAGNAVTVDGSLEPGTSTGQLTVLGGAVNFGATGSFVVEIDEVTTPGTDYDQLVVGPGGTVSIAAGATLTPAFGAFSAVYGDVVYLLDNQGGSPISGTFQYADDESIGAFNGRKWLITYDAIAGGALDGGNGIAIYAVPEPATFVLAALGAALLLRRRRGRDIARQATALMAALVASVLLVSMSSPGASLVWNNGAATGAWNTTDANWTGSTFTDDGVDDVTFSASSTETVAIAADMTPTATTVSAASGTYTFTGGGIDGGVLNKSGDGTLDIREMTGNGFSSINLSGGTILFDQNEPGTTGVNQLGSGTLTVSDDATLNFGYDFTAQRGGNVVNPMTIASGKTATLTRSGGSNYPTYSGLISGDGALRIEGTAGNQWRINNAGNSFTGGLTVAGAVLFYGPGTLGAATNTVDLQSGGLGLTAGSYAATQTLNIAGGSLAGSGATWNGPITGSANVVYSGGELIIANTTNTYSGNIQLNTGTITISDPGNLPGNAITFVNSNRTLRINGTSTGSFTNPLSIGSLSHFIDVTSAAASINWDGNISGGGLLQKTGDGAINFSALTHIGGMDVQAGRVNINGSTGANSASYSVDAGATLGGTGTINLAAGNAVTVDGSLEPGTSTGQMTVNGDVTFGATGSFVVEIDEVTTPGTDYDQLVVGPGGTVSIAAGATLTPAFGAFSAVYGDVVYLLDNQGGSPITGTFQYADDESIGSFNGRNWLITYDAIAGGALDGGFGVAIYAVPEPASVVLAALAGMLLLRRRTSRRHA